MSSFDDNGLPIGGVVAVRLPIPLDSMETLGAFVERVYGTGDTRMRAEGDQITIVAPEKGWGPRKRGRGTLPTATNDVMRLRHAELKEGAVKLTVEDTEHTVLLISEIARQWFQAVGGINYVETKLITHGHNEPEFVFTMQRIDGKTPAEKVADLEAELATLRAQHKIEGRNAT